MLNCQSDVRKSDMLAAACILGFLVCQEGFQIDDRERHKAFVDRPVQEEGKTCGKTCSNICETMREPNSCRRPKLDTADEAMASNLIAKGT